MQNAADGSKCGLGCWAIKMQSCDCRQGGSQNFELSCKNHLGVCPNFDQFEDFLHRIDANKI